MRRLWIYLRKRVVSIRTIIIAIGMAISTIIIAIGF